MYFRITYKQRQDNGELEKRETFCEADSERDAKIWAECTVYWDTEPKAQQVAEIVTQPTLAGFKAAK